MLTSHYIFINMDFNHSFDKINNFIFVNYFLTFILTGEISMQKVKVQRYISGKKPEYAQGVSSSDESDTEDFIEQQRPERKHQLAQITGKEEKSDSDNEVSLVISF